MKILITGNMGYIGPLVADRLRHAYPEARLIGFDMGYFAHCLTGASAFPERRLDAQYIGDVRWLTADMLEGVDAIVHLAAISNDPMGKAFEQLTAEINHGASVRLARLAEQAGVQKFVFASSCSMYGFTESGARCESDTVNPLTAYARSKVAVEQEIQALAHDGFAVTSLRFATACGMSERLRLDLVLNDFVAGALVNKEISILSDGTPWRPLIHVRDMARAIEWAVGRDADNGGAFLAVNAGSNEWNYQVHGLAEAVARAVPGVDVRVNRTAPPDKRSYRVNFDLFRRLAPQHQPQVDLTEAIDGLKQGLEAMDFHERDFRNSSFIRLRVLSALRASGVLNERLGWTQRAAA
jgi:nucleoside-diphosphate-sugar epimerase